MKILLLVALAALAEALRRAHYGDYLALAVFALCALVYASVMVSELRRIGDDLGDRR